MFSGSGRLKSLAARRRHNIENNIFSRLSRHFSAARIPIKIKNRDYKAIIKYDILIILLSLEALGGSFRHPPHSVRVFFICLFVSYLFSCRARAQQPPQHYDKTSTLFLGTDDDVTTYLHSRIAANRTQTPPLCECPMYDQSDDAVRVWNRTNK